MLGQELKLEFNMEVERWVKWYAYAHRYGNEIIIDSRRKEIKPSPEVVEAAQFEAIKLLKEKGIIITCGPEKKASTIKIGLNMKGLLAAACVFDNANEK